MIWLAKDGLLSEMYMTAKNNNLHAAKKAKNDEFYTRWEDVERELENYQDKFRGKTVYLNCDSAKSNFWLYFRICFDHLGLKKLVATHYDPTGGAYKLEYIGGLGKYHPDMGETGLYTTKTFLESDGDFRDPECLTILAESDIVVTNPPFSLFREFVNTITGFGKEFLVIGSMNAITYKEVFSLIKENILWLGVHSVKKFLRPDGELQTFGNICWFTNLDHEKRNEEILLWREYSEKDYPCYDNYEAIEVSKVVNIPANYGGVMGVPITFLTKYNPDQFKIVGAMTTTKITEDNHGYPYVGGFRKYARILIKRKVE